MRRADKLQARHVLIVGEDEIRSGIAQLKNMDAGTQSTVTLDQIDISLPTLLQGELKP
jgi:histidyl-tRNA synthetase